MSQTEVQLIKSSSVVDGDIVGMSSSKLSGALPAISGASLTGITAGITMADQWRVTTDRNISANTETIDANWERVDNSIWGQIGSGMTESSGIFTFPSTGIYLVAFNLVMYSISSTQRYSGALISTTLNNGGLFSTVATTYFNGGVNSGSGVYMAGDAKFLMDVTDTSNQKVRFRVQAGHAAAAYVAGNSNEQITGVTFIRLGDT
jgi:hypothetical protein